jgi:hypothetical protein
MACAGRNSWRLGRAVRTLASVFESGPEYHRAVQDQSRGELSISVSSQQQQRVLIAFDDSGPGVASPEDLFRPFQPGVAGTGLDSMCRVSSYGASAETCASRDDRKNPVSSSNWKPYKS